MLPGSDWKKYGNVQLVFPKTESLEVFMYKIQNFRTAVLEAERMFKAIKTIQKYHILIQFTLNILIFMTRNLKNAVVLRKCLKIVYFYT